MDECQKAKIQLGQIFTKAARAQQSSDDAKVTVRPHEVTPDYLIENLPTQLWVDTDASLAGLLVRMAYPMHSAYVFGKVRLLFLEGMEKTEGQPIQAAYRDRLLRDGLDRLDRLIARKI